MQLTNFLLCSGIFAAVSGTAIIDPSLKQRFVGGTENVMVSFNQGIQTVIDRINGMTFSSPQAKRTALTNAQETFTNGVQAPLKVALNAMGVQYESFWINNKMVVKNANPSIVSAISKVPGVAKIEKEPVVNLNPLNVGVPEEKSRMYRQASNSSNSTVEWGITKIQADKVWDSYKGKGIVVAGIDTGVRYTHEALRGRWREEYGWYDATALLPILRSRTPLDFNGHGTHTMGTIAGTHGIGVSPEATWIACKACTSLSCPASALMKCGEFVQCPTDYMGNNKNCSMAPHVVSNSWGGRKNDPWYNDIVKSWRAVDIIPVFSIGNSGPRCETANSPGDQPNLISVGSTEENDQISEFSSLGPNKNGNVLTIKPEIAAPGGDIRSAWYSSDTAYNTISGTSMACPHVSGTVALMLSKKSSLKYDDIFKAITSTATRSGLDASNAPLECGKVSTSSWPNNVWGHGVISALGSVNAVN